MLRKFLLVTGIAASLLYLAMNIFIPPLFDGYSVRSQAISELSAIGAPTREVWTSLVLVYAVLMAAFGWGVWASAAGRRGLRVAGALVVVNSAIGLAWPPMQLRGQPMATTDVLHIVFAVVTVSLFFLTMAFAAGALGRGFRWYSIGTIVVFLVFGTLTALDAPRLAANAPTPWLGVWERINIGAYMLWIIVLAVRLLRRPRVVLAEPAGSAAKVAGMRHQRRSTARPSTS